MSQTVTLRPITKENWQQAIRLKVKEGQDKFVAPSWYSILQAHFEDHTVRAIYAGETLVGMTMYNYMPAEKAGYISRLLIDREHQRKGYGAAAMELILADLQLLPACEYVYISFVPENESAQTLYAKLGFEDTGTVEDGEIVFRKNLRSSP